MAPSKRVELVWNALALPGLVACVIEVALAYVIHTTRPGVRPNTLLALALLFHGLTNGTYSSRLLLAEPADGYAILFVFMPLAFATAVFLTLFAGTFPTPLAAPLRSRAAPFFAGGLATAITMLLFAWPSLFVLSIRPFPRTTGFEFANGPLWQAFSVLFVLSLLYALACALHAWRRAAPGIARRRAGTIALGLGVQNAVDAVVTLYLVRVGPLDSLMPTVLNFVAQPLTGLFLACCIAYGILRFQLFDIDLRLKRGIRGGALAGAFFGVFFVATEGAQILFERSVGPIVGLVAAGVLVFALHPLQRVADRVANAAMPEVHATPQYIEYRRMEIYREAVDSVLTDGDVTPKERAMLDRLRAKLGIAEADARALEADILRSRSA